MSLPAILFGSVISTLLGAIFHLWRGGGLGRFIYYIILGWIGFWIGHALASYFEWTWDSLGSLHLGTAVSFSILLMLIGYWLSLVQTEKP